MNNDIKIQIEDLKKLKKKWQKIKLTSKIIATVGASGFIVSLLSPLDIEGPTIEIITGAISTAGITLGKVSETKIEELKEEINILEKNNSLKLSKKSK